MSFQRRHVISLAAGAALIASLAPAAATAGTAGAAKSLGYFMPGDGRSDAYLIDWLPKNKARLVSIAGAQSGRVTDDGVQKLVALDAPLTMSFTNYDECGEEIQQRRDVNQVVVRDLPDSVTQFVEMGTVTNIGGCQDGLVTPFGAVGDAGQSFQRLNMKNRPSVGDLVPGSQVAGFSEDVQLPGESTIAEDVVMLQEGGSAMFQVTGHVVPAAFDANQWLVFTFTFGQRAYTRVDVDSAIGGETWLMADWVGGQPVRVEEKLMVKPEAGAGFGTVAQASRIWNSGLFIDSRTPFYFYLYKNGTGERVLKDLDLGTESRTPITAWGFEGLNLVQRRKLSASARRDRTWVPLRNVGKVRWIMESEVFLDRSGTTVLIKPRVNYVQDEGKAVPPAAAVPSAGFVSMNDKPTLPR
ncbi:hypothetical protein AACH06_00965 [Ideonella sp. DXS29W]|uniref:Uncharacterized protein n=1 Tax=Ideonella lacteola TaxID=2984193 RepID=A0ABU9BL81_9BURK